MKVHGLLLDRHVGGDERHTSTPRTTSISTALTIADQVHDSGALRGHDLRKLLPDRSDALVHVGALALWHRCALGEEFIALGLQRSKTCGRLRGLGILPRLIMIAPNGVEIAKLLFAQVGKPKPLQLPKGDFIVIGDVLRMCTQVIRNRVHFREEIGGRRLR
jgi:hypothetical protein